MQLQAKKLVYNQFLIINQLFNFKHPRSDEKLKVFKWPRLYQAHF